MAPSQDEQKVVKDFKPFPFIFHDGVVMTTVDGRVSVDILESANPKLAELASILLNGSEVGFNQPIQKLAEL